MVNKYDEQNCRMVNDRNTIIITRMIASITRVTASVDYFDSV